MLTTIIYRRHISGFVPTKALSGMVEAASLFNASYDVTGILLFNGTHFFSCPKARSKVFSLFINIFVRIAATTTLWS